MQHSLFFAFCICLSLIATAAGQRVQLGTLSTIFHRVSGTVYAIDESTLLIENFQYDGTTQNVFVYVHRKGVVVGRRNGIIVDWSLFRSEIPMMRFGLGSPSIDVTLSLNNLRVSDLQTITIWCQPVGVFFGRLNIPASLTINLAPGLPALYCVQLHESLQVIVGYNNDTIRIKQCGCIDADQYMAFGISGRDSSTFMVGADVTVTWVNDQGPNAIDYYLTQRQQCRGGEGVCPDTLLAGNGGSQDVSMITGDVQNGQRCVQYERPLTTTDPNDRAYLIDGTSQFVAWAIGPRATEEGLRDLAFFHTEWPRNGANFELNFMTGPTGELRCTEELQCGNQPMACPPWAEQSITATNSTTFRVRIGPSGGLRGYQAITELSGWGIAYYIDDMLIPVLRLSRNVTYTFIVEAGNNATNGPQYHPFYITDSLDGGILLDSATDRLRKNEAIFAGYNTQTNQVTAAGRYCEHVETAQSGPVAEDCAQGVQDYQSTLQVSCEGSDSEVAILEWTPDENTPDVVYYQCANHIHLGWQIRLDSGCSRTFSLAAIQLLMMVAATFTAVGLFAS